MHFTRMKQAAHELVRLAGIGNEIEADLLAWARQIVIQNPSREPFKPSPNQDKILTLLENAPFDGLTAEQLSFRAEIPKNLMSATLSYMVNTTGIIVAIKLPRMSVYFRNQAALEIGKPLVLAAEECRKVLKAVKVPRPSPPSKEERQRLMIEARTARKHQRVADKQAKKDADKQLKATQRQARLDQAAAARQVKRDSWAVRNKPRPTQKQDMTIKARPNVVIAPPKPADIRRSVFIPEDFPITKLPSGRDTRYDPDPNSDGAGFMSDWKRKRGTPEEA